jgi:hypothetical protein
VVKIETRVPFIDTSVYTRWWDAIVWARHHEIGPIGRALTWLAMRIFTPHIPTNLFDKIDHEANIAFAGVADALENRDPTKLEHLFEPTLYSLLLDNFEEFHRLNSYRLAVHKIENKRLDVKIHWRLPPFAHEIPVEIPLWDGGNFIYSHPGPSASRIMNERKRLVQAVGSNYALLKQSIAENETPQDGGLELYPIPKRLNTSSHAKKRVTAYTNKPFIGDLVGFIRYLLAIRRLGTNYLLRQGKLEIEIVYAFNAHHDLSIVSRFDDPKDKEMEDKLVTKEDKELHEVKQRLKYPAFEDQPAPHVAVLRSVLPLHPSGGAPTAWRFSEFDGMRNTEEAKIAKLVRLSKHTAEEIDKSLPALRIFSKDFFTPLGPTKEWYKERERLKRVAMNRALHGSLDDPGVGADTPTPLDKLQEIQEKHIKQKEDENLKGYRDRVFGKINLGKLGDVKDDKKDKDSKAPL